MTIKKATKADLDLVTKKLLLLYEDNNYEDLFEENKKTIIKKNQAFFLAFEIDECIGVAHCALRYDYVEGTEGGNIGYLEGIYVDPDYRMKGVAKALVSECEKWASSMGCAEMASDCELSNTTSYNFHTKIGYTEANRIICFTKKLENQEQY